jgi:hypothetical protein
MTPPPPPPLELPPLALPLALDPEFADVLDDKEDVEPSDDEEPRFSSEQPWTPTNVMTEAHMEKSLRVVIPHHLSK